MLRIAIGLFLIAIVAAFFGMGGVASIASSGAQLFLFLFIVLAVLGLLFGRRIFS